jgi:hypothetical protein
VVLTLRLIGFWNKGEIGDDVIKENFMEEMVLELRFEG